MKKLRLGVIGACGRGTLADWAHQPQNGVEIVAGADIYEEQRKSFVERYKKEKNADVKAYADYREMIEKENLDGLFVTSPDFCHEEHACHALQNKVAVYLEKPIAITLEGADRILKTAHDNKTPLMLGHNMRYMDFTRKMREIIQSGVIGEVKAIWCRHFISYGGDAYFRDWHADIANTNTLLLQKGAHDIDIIHWLAGARSVRVNGFGALTAYGSVPRRPLGDEQMGNLNLARPWTLSSYPPENLKDFYPTVNNEDINMITMQLENGVQASYMQCHFAPDACRNYTVIGTRGRLENFGDNGYHSIQVWTKRTDRYDLNGDITYRFEPNDGGHGGADPRIVQGFIDMLQKGVAPDTTPQWARHSVATGILGAKSIRTGGTPYEIPALSEELENYDFSQSSDK
ncbi:MAG: Gfo/Idh/MocA family oxidoreductase [Lentisphaeria bacterium]|nr:Gfo/Idh/MocA family oxidoreductase [Lentisphaeria bacterium]